MMNSENAMITIDSSTVLRDRIKLWKQEGYRIAFVPTMGNLHAGHLSLLERCRQHDNTGKLKLVVSIFVNPMQFGENEDFDSYPRTIDADTRVLAENNVDLLFVPQATEIYPDGLQAATRVMPAPLIGDILEGEHRPGFFTGVATVVAILFNIVQPDVACFGEKDYQQLLVIRHLVADLALPVEIISVPIVREADGLAMSSRNQYLSEAERAQAGKLNVCLQHLIEDVMQGTETNFAVIHTTQELEANDFTVDYVVIRRQSDLGVPEPGDNQLVALVAAWLDGTRLIDNMCFEINA